MRSRRRRTRLIVWLLATGAAFAAHSAQAQTIDGYPDSRFIEQRERVTPTDGDAVDVRFLITRDAATQATRIVNAAQASVSLMFDWFGPLPSASLTIGAVPWRPGAIPALRPGVAVAPMRWLAPVREQSTERAVIAAIARQYWGSESPTAFEDALNIYIGTRAIHQLLEGSNFATPRFFGDAIPFALRSVLLSPPVADPRPRFFGFVEVQQGRPLSGDVAAMVRGLQTLERFVGWPTLLDALSRIRAEGRRDPASLASALSDAHGTDIRTLVARCLAPSTSFDYALDDMQSQSGAAGLIETRLSIRRASADAFGEMPILVRFADGSDIRDAFDGDAESATLTYSAKAPAVAAWIDPDSMLMLDRQRENNAIVRARHTSRLGIRLALQWMAWLQNAMLAYTAAL